MMRQRRRLLRALAALPVAIVGGALPGATARADASAITLSGTAWYDDDGNHVIDPGEVPAAGSDIDVIGEGQDTRSQLGHAVAGSDGRFAVSFTMPPDLLNPPATTGPGIIFNLWLTTATLRPGYPYRPCPPLRSSSERCSPVNYAGTVAIPVEGGPTRHIDLPLSPYPGILDRLPPGASPDFPVPGGHFFTQTNGFVGGSSVGFGVTNADRVLFWDTWQRYGLDNIGYPLSRRFVWRGLPTQVFQKAILQWRTDANSIAFVNIFDDLHQAGRDAWLHTYYATPPQIDPSFDAGKPWGQIVRDRLRLLVANPAIEARYRAAADPLLLYGLPTSHVEDMGNAWVIRTQRTVFQQWKTDTPWAKAGGVTLANGGEIALKGSLVPPDWISPLPPG